MRGLRDANCSSSMALLIGKISPCRPSNFRDDRLDVLVVAREPQGAQRRQRIHPRGQVGGTQAVEERQQRLAQRDCVMWGFLST